MEITKGFQLTEPKFFIPWGITEQELKPMFPSGQLREVSNGYMTTSCISFRNLKHELGFHFNPRKNGKLGMLEFFRKDYRNIDQSFRDFQQHFVGEFGLPHSTTRGAEGYPIYRWQFEHISIDHTIIDRFGPQEHMRISNLVYRLDPKLQFNNFFVFELTQSLREVIPLESTGSDKSGWRQFYKNSAGNWIKFFPYSEYHGGGQPYLVLTVDHEPEQWLLANENLEEMVRAELDKIGS